MAVPRRNLRHFGVSGVDNRLPIHHIPRPMLRSQIISTLPAAAMRLGLPCPEQGQRELHAFVLGYMTVNSRRNDGVAKSG